MSSMLSRAEQAGWVFAFGLVVALAFPWFLWGVDRVVAGLPVWLWWQIGWLGVTAVVFRLFTARAWGLGVTRSAGTREEGERA